MMMLEDIVPPLYLCEQISKDSALGNTLIHWAFVWAEEKDMPIEGYWCIQTSGCKLFVTSNKPTKKMREQITEELGNNVIFCKEVYPAPTLEEILTALRKISAELPTVFVQERQFQILADAVPHQTEIWAHQSGATAALQTWLEITRQQAKLQEMEA